MQNTQNSQAAGLASKEKLWPVQSQPAASNRRMDQGGLQPGVTTRRFIRIVPIFSGVRMDVTVDACGRRPWSDMHAQISLV